MDVPVRVAIAVFVICAPTLLFLGLWRGLTSLREDDLAGEVSARQLRGVFEALPSGQPDAGRFEELPDGGAGSAVLGRSHRSASTPRSVSRSVHRTESGGREGESGDGTRNRPLDSEAEPEAAIEIGVETDPEECLRCTEFNPTGAELCWGYGAYLDGTEGTT